MTHVDLAPLMEAIGPLDDDILAIAAVGESWVVRLEDLDIQVEEEREPRRHLFTVALTAPADANRAELHETLLRYNLLRRETGTCMALGPEGEIVLMAEATSEGAGAQSLLEALQNVAAKARAWGAVAQAPAGGAIAAPDLDLAMTAIRI